MSSHSDGWRIQLSTQQLLQLQLVKHDAKVAPGGHLLRRGGSTLHFPSVGNLKKSNLGRLEMNSAAAEWRGRLPSEL